MGKELLIVRDVVNHLVEMGALLPTGEWSPTFNVNSIATDLTLAVAVEQILVAHGVPVPGNVDKIIQALPAIVTLLGLTK